MAEESSVIAANAVCAGRKKPPWAEPSSCTTRTGRNVDDICPARCPTYPPARYRVSTEARGHVRIDRRGRVAGDQPPEQQEVHRHQEREHRQRPGGEHPVGERRPGHDDEQPELDHPVHGVLERDPHRRAQARERRVLQAEHRPRHRRHHEPAGERQRHVQRVRRRRAGGGTRPSPPSAPSTASPTATPYDISTSRRVPAPARGRNRISAWPKSAWVRIDTSSISEIRALPRPTSSGVDVRAATIQ